METSKRSFTIVILAWASSLFLAGLVTAYYYMELQKQISANEVYIKMYNDLLGNYTNLLKDYSDLLNDYNSLVQEYEHEKTNLTQTLEKYKKCIIKVNICIDYCMWNGDIEWFNNTVVPLGCDLLTATKMIAVVNYTYWQAYQACFVDAINGIWNNGTCYWMWYYWDSEKNAWEYGCLLYTSPSPRDRG